jgi:hypothetical protein
LLIEETPDKKVYRNDLPTVRVFALDLVLQARFFGILFPAVRIGSAEKH